MFNIKVYNRNWAFIQTLNEKEISCNYNFSASVNIGIKCLATDVFAEVEEKLCKRFDNLRNTNNMFTVNARPILRFKKMFENQIKDGDIIQLFKLE